MFSWWTNSCQFDPSLAVVVVVLPVVTFAPMMGTPCVSFSATIVAVPFLMMAELLADTCGTPAVLILGLVHGATARHKSCQATVSMVAIVGLWSTSASIDCREPWVCKAQVTLC